jgi:hypothetical protein
MTINNLKASILAHITAIAAAEKITRASLGEISRELIMYVPDTKDIDLVNRLLGVLTPMNRATAVLYFKHFLPWEFEEDANKFGSMMQGDKKIAKRLTLITDFLKDTNNNIWTWADEHVTIERVKPDLGMNITEAVNKALSGTKETRTKEAADGISKAEALAAFLDANISIDDVLEAITTAKAASDKALANAMKEAA